MAVVRVYGYSKEPSGTEHGQRSGTRVSIGGLERLQRGKAE